MEFFLSINIASDSSCSCNIRIHKLTEKNLQDKLDFDGYKIVEN